MSFSRALLQVLAGVLLVAGLGYALQRWASSRPVQLPPGFHIPWPGAEVAALVEADGHVWAGGKEGLARFDRRTGERRPLPGSAPALAYVKALALDDRGHLWVAHADGFERWDGTTWARFGKSLDSGLAPALSLLQAPGGLWGGTEKGLYRFGHGAWKPFPVPAELRIPSFDVLFEDPGGALWVGSAAMAGGLWRFQDGAWTAYGCAEGLPHASVNALGLGPDGALWVGTGFADLGGAARLSEGRWVPLLKKDGLAGNKVRSLFLDRSGLHHFGSEYDGLAIRNPQGWRYLGPGDGLAGREIKAILQDADGTFWLGMDTGLSRVEGLSTMGRDSAP